MKMKYRNKFFHTVFLEGYLSCLDQNEREDITRDLTKNAEFKDKFTHLVFNFHLAHEFYLQNNLYMTDELDLYEINNDNMDKTYPIYIYENLLIDLLADYQAEEIKTCVTGQELVNILQSYSSNKIELQEF